MMNSWQQLIVEDPRNGRPKKIDTDRIEQLLRTTDLSQAEIARICGVANQRVSEIRRTRGLRK